jgi:hypothetical protein
MIHIIVFVTKGVRLGERQIAEIVVTFPVVHRVVLVPLPQSEITSVVAMVVVVPQHKLAVVVVPEHEVVVMRLAEHQVVVVVRVAEHQVVVAEVEPVVVMILPEVVVALPQRQLGGVLPVPQDQLVVGHHQSPPRNSTRWSNKQTIESATRTQPIRGDKINKYTVLPHNSTRTNRQGRI